MPLSSRARGNELAASEAGTLELFPRHVPGRRPAARTVFVWIPPCCSPKVRGQERLVHSEPDRVRGRRGSDAASSPPSAGDAMPRRSATMAHAREPSRDGFPACMPGCDAAGGMTRCRGEAPAGGFARPRSRVSGHRMRACPARETGRMQEDRRKAVTVRRRADKTPRSPVDANFALGQLDEVPYETVVPSRAASPSPCSPAIRLRRHMGMRQPAAYAPEQACGAGPSHMRRHPRECCRLTVDDAWLPAWRKRRFRPKIHRHRRTSVSGETK